MSVCVEQTNFKNNVKSNHFSRSIIVPDRYSKHSRFNSRKRNIFQVIKFWRSKSRQRKSLALLDDRLLADIGFSQVQARKEFSKPFWK